jgi:2-aminomuconate deaminase
MSKEAKVLEGRAQPLGRYPHIRRAGDFLYVSGTSSRRADNTHEGVTLDADGTVHKDVAVQTKAVIENVRGILQSAGADLKDIVDVTTFLVNMDDFEGYNAVYGTYFGFDGPTRTTVAVYQLPHPNLLIEMKVIAYLPL